jgi:hypothetical protein
MSNLKDQAYAILYTTRRGRTILRARRQRHIGPGDAGLAVTLISDPGRRETGASGLAAAVALPPSPRPEPALREIEIKVSG